MYHGYTSDKCKTKLQNLTFSIDENAKFVVLMLWNINKYLLDLNIKMEFNYLQ